MLILTMKHYMYYVNLKCTGIQQSMQHALEYWMMTIAIWAFSQQYLIPLFFT